MLATWVKQHARKFGVGLYRIGEEGRLAEAGQLRRFLKHFEVDCVFDVGANVGQYATGLREAGFAGQILSFEPHPQAFEKLKAAAHGDDKWAVHPQALDSEPRDIAFNLMQDSQFSSIKAPDHDSVDIFKEMNNPIESIRIKSTTVDSVYDELAARFAFKRPFLKLDTQGHDSAVIQGAARSIQHFVGLQSELAITRLYKDSPRFTESIAFYESLGFRLTALVPNNAGHFPDLHEIDCIMYNPAIPMPQSEGSSGHGRISFERV